jgi:hypothetical protein
MILHFNYHVSKIFYGIDVSRPGADGTISPMVHVVRAAFYHLPMLFIAGLVFFESQRFKIFMFAVSVAYTLSHVMHVWTEITKPVFDWSQITLMNLVLFFSVLINVCSWNYYRKG